jgi:hypothetical protein
MGLGITGTGLAGALGATTKVRRWEAMVLRANGRGAGVGLGEEGWGWL